MTRFSDDDVFYLFLQKQKIGAKLHIYLSEGTISWRAHADRLTRSYPLLLAEIRAFSRISCELRDFFGFRAQIFNLRRGLVVNFVVNLASARRVQQRGTDPPGDVFFFLD